MSQWANGWLSQIHIRRIGLAWCCRQKLSFHSLFLGAMQVPLTLVRVKTAQQAQQSPSCPYGVMDIFYNGHLVSYRPIGAKELMETIRHQQIKL